MFQNDLLKGLFHWFDLAPLSKITLQYCACQVLYCNLLIDSPILMPITHCSVYYRFNIWASQVVQRLKKNPPTNAGAAADASSILRSGRSPGEGNGNPLQYSCLENSMDRGAWWATAHRSQRVRHDRVTEKSDVTKPANRTG